jgi:UDP-N-acetyl-alpha-D-muramoyl-L-alanyl-L-glutamate epimerase
MNPSLPYAQFIFESYDFDRDAKTLNLHYSLDGDLTFTETYRFNFDFVDYDEAVFNRAAACLWLLAGVSYYKKFIPREIAVKGFDLDPFMAKFFTKAYERGLGEFWFVNQLDPHTPVTFRHTTDHVDTIHSAKPGEGLLVGIGGGKDSLVTAELLRGQREDINTWSVDHKEQLTPLIERIGFPHFWAERIWDRKLMELKGQSLSGHVPISGIIGLVGILTAILAGKRDVVVSNEQSANEPDFTYQGIEINHQYSKSQEYEDDFQKLLTHLFGDELRYYSFLRPLSELRIAEIFAQTAFDKYKDVFSSCNRAFVHTSSAISWCGVCPKCAFTFLMLTPFIGHEKLEALWGGKNLLLDPALEQTYRQLLGIEGGKPLDCVGEVKESRSAMALAQEMYPELKDKYKYELPDDYDYRKLHSHHMPPELFTVLQTRLQQIDHTAETADDQA